MAFSESSQNFPTGTQQSVSLPTPHAAKNVLFIVVDDMRPMMRRAYNFSLGVTPNLDRLSEGGLTFTRAYCNYAFCSPSRNSFMSGRRPDVTRVWEFKDSFREHGVGANWTALPEYFKRCHFDATLCLYQTQGSELGWMQ